MQSAALAGLRVLDISTFLAAPQISAMLGDFGADVVKLEPPGGEALRKIGAQRNGHSLQWAMTSRNKRTITCDLDTDEGRDLLLGLHPWSFTLAHARLTPEPDPPLADFANAFAVIVLTSALSEVLIYLIRPDLARSSIPFVEWLVYLLPVAFLCFVQTAGDTFELREVELGGEYGDIRVLLSGLRPDEKIVLDGAFHLNNERKRLATQGD